MTTNSSPILLSQEVDPETNEPYDVPMLSIADPDYRRKYAAFVKTKQENPALAEAIMEWK